MGRTFSNCGYTVTVNDDRSILVRPGDWISKYAAAIYGNPKVNWDKFKKKENGQYRRLSNPAMIVVGQRVYHPDPLPDEPGFGVNPPVPSDPSSPTPGTGQLVAERVVSFLRYIAQVACPVTDWSVAGTSGVDAGISFVTGGIAQVDLLNHRTRQEYSYYGIALGISAGLSDFYASLSISPPSYENFASGIGKFITAGATLSPDEICGNFMTLDFGAGAFLGVSLSFLFFGANTPPQAFARTVGRYFQGGNENILVLPSVFRGMLVSFGPNACSPDAAVSLKMGIMHRWECMTG
jgi:hypothetical protein